MNVWFTADTHFGHAAVVGHCNRPFTSIEKHDEALIRNWNAVVAKGDVVYHLGDFAWKFPALYLDRLNGQIHLVKGNHDRLNVYATSRFVSVSDLKKIKIGDQKIYLCHYAMRLWNCSHHGAWHLYGHSHGSLPDDPYSLSFDVGVDSHSYRPISFAEVAAIMAKKQYRSIDHHSPKEIPEAGKLILPPAFSAPQIISASAPSMLE